MTSTKEFQRFYRDDVTDRQLAHFYDDVCRAGRERSFFYDRPKMSTQSFIKWVRSPDLFPWIVTFRGQPVALVALNCLKGKTAYGHFLFLPCDAKRTARHMTVQQGTVLSTLAYWLNVNGAQDKPVLDRVLGVTPATNKAALHLVQQMGGILIGAIPGVCYMHDTDENVDGILSIQTRETVPADAVNY